ncbi:MAG TPA: hypothetical protein VFE65_04895, partial [Pseudonocardia sp.]|nr:hypothetical protein [Pseudonocardia sp.]
QTPLAQLAGDTNLASVVAPAYSLPNAVFPDTLISLGIGVLIGAAIGGLICFNMVRRWTAP